MNGPADNTPACPVCHLAPQVRGCVPGRCGADPARALGARIGREAAAALPGVSRADVDAAIEAANALAGPSVAARLRGMASDPRNIADMRVLVAAKAGIAQRDRAVALLRSMESPAFHGTYDGCYLCGGEGGKHGPELLDGDVVPCRLGALLAEDWAKAP